MPCQALVPQALTTHHAQLPTATGWPTDSDRRPAFLTPQRRHGTARPSHSTEKRRPYACTPRPSLALLPTSTGTDAWALGSPPHATAPRAGSVAWYLARPLPCQPRHRHACCCSFHPGGSLNPSYRIQVLVPDDTNLHAVAHAQEYAAPSHSQRVCVRNVYVRTLDVYHTDSGQSTYSAVQENTKP